MTKPDPILDDLKRAQQALDTPAVSIMQLREAVMALLQHAIEQREGKGGGTSPVGSKGPRY